MRRLFLAAFGVFAVAGVASAQQSLPPIPQPPTNPQPAYQQPVVPQPVYQQPTYQQPVYQQPVAPVQYPAASPGAVAATPVALVSGATVIQGSGGCTNCGPTTGKKWEWAHNCTLQNVTGGNCLFGYRCQNGCGSVKSDFAFQFGNCAQFFSPCGPTVGGLWKKCGVTPFAGPYGTGWACPRQYDSYANH